MTALKAPAPATTATTDQLQELYRHLDHFEHGDKHMAYYGQLRAQEFSHHDALNMTLERFGLHLVPWHMARFPETPAVPDPIDFTAWTNEQLVGQNTYARLPFRDRTALLAEVDRRAAMKDGV